MNPTTKARTLRRAALAFCALAAGAVSMHSVSLLAAPQSQPRATGSALESRQDRAALERPASWRAVLGDSARTAEPVVVLFSTPGCAFCEAVRRDHLRHLAGARNGAGVRVVEFELGDRRRFTDLEAEAGAGAGAEAGAGVGAGGTGTASSPAALAASLGIRFAPTVAFIGPQGELAERLVGYQSADFYGAYLDERIASSREKLAGGAKSGRVESGGAESTAANSTAANSGTAE